MKKTFFSLTAAIAFFVFTFITTVTAQEEVKAQGGDLIDIAMHSPDCSKLVDAIKAADLVNTFKMAGPFTVFAPSNAAFDQLPAGEQARLMKNKTALSKMLRYHVVGGNWNSALLMAAIKQGNGSVELPTLSSGKLIATVEDGKIKITDENGSGSYITNADITASNGMMHLVDRVVQPAQQTVTKK